MVFDYDGIVTVCGKSESADRPSKRRRKQCCCEASSNYSACSQLWGVTQRTTDIMTMQYNSKQPS